MLWVPTVLAGVSRENEARAYGGREICCEVFHCRNYCPKNIVVPESPRSRPQS
jgi:hypothetical protein